ncbi:MAG: cysteine-rich small domain-containing protein [Clostridia bacterium]|nr:cysteine-rich small domain-containing protein [Clostridia bacterium]
MKNSFSYFKNDACEYFPCHKTEDACFNCLFCYCPLYTLGKACGGDFVYLENGVKDCTNCVLPHSKDGYKYIQSKLQEASGLNQAKM